MRAAWYEKQGAARDVLVVGEMDEPKPPAGEVRVQVAASGINPGDVKKRQNAFGVGMPYPRVIPPLRILRRLALLETGDGQLPTDQKGLSPSILDVFCSY